MKCPKCSSKTHVKNTRDTANAKKRLRKCRDPSCGFEFRTLEALVARDADFTTEQLLTAVCLHCGGKAQLRELKRMEDGISMQRTYECLQCKAVDYTVESPGERERDSIGLYGPVFVKSNGTRTAYSRDRLAEGLLPVRGKCMEESAFRRMIEEVHDQASAEREVTAQQIEDWILEHLKESNTLAYARLMIDFGRVSEAKQLKNLMEEDGE